MFTKDCFGPDSTRSFFWSIGRIFAKIVGNLRALSRTSIYLRGKIWRDRLSPPRVGYRKGDRLLFLNMLKNSSRSKTVGPWSSWSSEGPLKVPRRSPEGEGPPKVPEGPPKVPLPRRSPEGPPKVPRRSPKVPRRSPEGPPKVKVPRRSPEGPPKVPRRSPEGPLSRAYFRILAPRKRVDRARNVRDSNPPPPPPPPWSIGRDSIGSKKGTIGGDSGRQSGRSNKLNHRGQSGPDRADWKKQSLVKMQPWSSLIEYVVLIQLQNKKYHENTFVSFYECTFLEINYPSRNTINCLIFTNYVYSALNQTPFIVHVNQ